MENINNSSNQPAEREFDYFVIVLLLRKYWYIFISSFLLGILGVFLYLRNEVPVYSVSSKVFIKDNTNGPMGMGKFLDGMELVEPYSNLENEMIIIKSAKIIQKTLNKLNFNYSYFIKGNVKDYEYYPSAPIRIIPEITSPQLVNSKIFIMPIDEESYRLTLEKSNPYWYEMVSDTMYSTSQPIEIQRQYKYGETVEIQKARFQIVKDSVNKPQIDQEYYVVLKDRYSLMQKWRNSISIQPVNKESSIVEIYVTGVNYEQNVTFLNTLCQVYIQDGLDKKNQIALNTINFIDIQLGIVKDSLNTVENDLLKFRNKNKVMNITFEAEIDYEKLKMLESEKASLEIKQKYYEYLMKYVSSSTDLDGIVVPSILDINDVTLNKLITELVELVNDRETLMKNNPSKSNPFVQNLDSKIAVTKAGLIENLRNLNKSSEITMKELNKNIDKFQKNLNKLPSTEREFLTIERKFNVNDEIYNYLLEKREEASIAKATNTSDNYVVDLASIYDAAIISPKPKILYAISIVASFFIPMTLLLIMYFIDDKIYSKEDIAERTNIPNIGNVVHNLHATDKTVLLKPKSGIAESFRSIKINLSFINNPVSSYVIGVTSSLSGEGKTFVSFNLASIYALSGKKVVLVSMDLRKPGIDKLLFKSQDKGLSNYLAGMVDSDSIIHKTEQHENLYFIPSGAVPPNPAELLNGNKIKELIKELRTKFDIIILDNSPVGLVADYLNIIDQVDSTLYIVRQGVTPKRALDGINDMYVKGNIKNVCLVLNDSITAYEKYSNYGTGYYYSESHSGYFENELDKKWYKPKTWFKG